MSMSGTMELLVTMLVLTCGAWSVTGQIRVSYHEPGALQPALPAEQPANETSLTVAIRHNTSLEDFGDFLDVLTYDGDQPIDFARSMTFYNAAETPVTLDFAYLSGLIAVLPGVTITFKGLRLERMEDGVPVGFVKGGPGATIVFEDCINHLQVAAPLDFQHAFFSNVPRPDGGEQLGAIDRATQSYLLTDVAFTTPVKDSILDGYGIQFKNTRLTSDVIVSQRTGSCPQQYTGQPDMGCTSAVLSAIKQQLCSMPGCINSCSANCPELPLVT